MKSIAILGSTGSVGRSALDVAAHLGYEVAGLAARSSAAELLAQIGVFKPARAALSSPEACAELRKGLNGARTVVHEGPEGVVELARAGESEVVLCAISGAAGLPPVLAAAEEGKTLALANKESMVMAGPLLLEIAERTGAVIVPVDSEHSAVFQALRSGRRSEVRRIFLTASGGPFARTPKDQFPSITVEQALKHPTWNMGGKITIDSATMFNKALEIVEAKWLFGLDAKQIEVLVHPQSIIHSMVEFVDGSVVAQLGLPDMRTPIQFAFTYPERAPGNVPLLDLSKVKTLTFEAPDFDKFPSLKLGYRAAEAGGTMGAVLNAANEVAVELFTARKIPFLKIFEVVERVMSAHATVARPALADVLRADAWAREEALRCSS